VFASVSVFKAKLRSGACYLEEFKKVPLDSARSIYTISISV